MFIVEIPRKYLSPREEMLGVKMYFDVNLKDQGGTSHRINGFRLVQKEGKKFIGFPSIVGKDNKRYPIVIPSKELSAQIQVAAEVEYARSFHAK